jgi:hypothetical protein
MTRRVALALGLALYGVVVGFLGGLLAERLLYDRQRASVLSRVAAAEQRLHARLMEIEREREAPPILVR